MLAATTELQTTRPFPELSPDGAEFLVAGDADVGRAIWLHEMPTATERQLTFEGKSWGMESWHPDGQRILAYVEPEYEAVLFTLDGSQPPRPLVRATADSSPRS